MKHKTLSPAVLMMLLLGPLAAGAMPILNVDGSGQLLGASNVDVGGALYNVEFVDGTCVDLFDGCDDVSDFAFQTFDSALAASEALMDAVFIDGPQGAFDTDPTLTNGCTSTLVCSALTPFAFGTFISDRVDAIGAINLVNETSDGSAVQPNGPSIDTGTGGSGVGTVVWARWTTYAVPEPGTVFLFGLGLAGIGLVRRRQRRGPAAV